MEDIKYERECGAPENWQSNVILRRCASGEVIVSEVPDEDQPAGEVTNDDGND